MKTFLSVLIYVLVAISILQAQRPKLDEAAKNFDEFDYAKAIEGYEDLVQEGYSNRQIFQKLAEANFLNSNYIEAAKWYRGHYLTSHGNIGAEHLFRYALSLKSLKRYEEAFKILKEIRAISPNDSRIKLHLNNPDYIKHIERLSNRGELFKLPFNSELSDFAPAFYRDGLVFASARKTKKRDPGSHGWNQMPFLNLFTTYKTNSGKIKVKSFSDKLNSRAHESSAVFSNDGNTAYFTRNNLKGNEFGRDQSGVSRLKIYRSFKKNGSWSDPEQLSFNNDSYSSAHPALSPDGKRLYFASDMPGTFGNSDIFYVNILPNGRFGKPRNLGPDINTEGRESFPFISESGILHFASDGHPGLGGLDVYGAKKDGENQYKVLNLGRPINSEMDDFGFIFNEEKSIGYFTSNRSGGEGSDDIYGFKQNIPLDYDCSMVFSGKIVNLKNNAPIENAIVELRDGNNIVQSESFTRADGQFYISSGCNQSTLQLVVNKTGFHDEILDLDIEAASNPKNIEVALKSAPIAAEKGTNLAKLLKIMPLIFDKGKSYIRPDTAIQLNKLYIYLRDFPQVNIEIQQYTDSRGSSSNNLILSKSRAKSIKDYLIAIGVGEDRMTIKGFGESKLINHCANGVQCSEKEHQENNRSEFIVIN